MKIIFIWIFKSYKNFISPIFVQIFGNACRFTPTCSEYTIEALEKYGVARGLTLGVKRVLKCHPFGGAGYDPVK